MLRNHTYYYLAALHLAINSHPKTNAYPSRYWRQLHFYHIHHSTKVSPSTQLSNEIIVANPQISIFTCAFAMIDSRKHFKRNHLHSPSRP
jgi:hypothetical protein